jgi:predicted XRE-type DNA-binding protein
MTAKSRRSTRNVFQDLGFGPDDADNLKLRADLMIELSKLVKAPRLTQAKAAKVQASSKSGIPTGSV